MTNSASATVAVAANVKTGSKNKNYTYKVVGVDIKASGVQQKGRGQGLAYAMGMLEVLVTNKKGESVKIRKSFTAFDAVYDSGKGIKPAERLMALKDSGEAFYATGQYREQNYIDPANPEKGKWKVLNLAFVESAEERTANAEARKAAKAQANEAVGDEAGDEHGEDEVQGQMVDLDDEIPF